MDTFAFLAEQYETVRQESLEALGQMQTVNQWALGSVGVAVGLGLVASQHSAPAAAAVFMGLVPILVTFGIVEMTVIASRVIHARRYLRKLEAHLVDHMPDIPPNINGWERERAIGFRVGSSGYPFLVVALGATMAIGPGLGGTLLAIEAHWMAFALGETFDIVGLVIFTIWIVRTFLSMKTLNSQYESP
jgi:hypothetical protein